MRDRRKALIAILAACFAAGVLVLGALGGFSGRLLRLRTGVQAPAPSPGGSARGSIGVEGAGPANTGPAYSPDGRQVAFSTNLRGRPHIWIISVDGSNLRQLTSNLNPDPASFESAEIQPAWSPDGTRIAFASNVAGNLDIWVVRSDGSGLARLTTDPADDMMPAWSPDSTQIAFASNRSGSREIWIMNADGTNQRRVTSVGLGKSFPAFSPDGRQFVFTSAPQSSSSNLFIINVDGTGLRQLTTGVFYDSRPSWSTRGIVFDSSRTGGVSLWLVQPDGSGLQAMPSAMGGEPAVSPDGTKVAFSTDDGIYEFNFLDSTIRHLVNIKGFAIAVQVMGIPIPQGVVPIAVDILTTPTFNPVLQIDQTSITFGVSGDERSLISCQTVDARNVGVSDLVCAFDPRLTGFNFSQVVAGVTQGILRAIDVNQIRLEGRGPVTVPCDPRWGVSCLPP